MPINKKSFQSYAIFVRSSYGDLLMTDPLIKYIKKINKNNLVTLFVEDKNFQLVEFMEEIDFVCKIPSKGNKYFLYTYYGLKFRKNKYDISIAAKTGVGSANGFFQFMLGAKKKISYVSENKTWTDKLVNHPIIYNEQIYHRQHYALGVLQLLDKTFTNIPKNLFPKIKCDLKPKRNPKLKLFLSVSNTRDSCTLNNNKTASIINTLSKNFEFDLYISALEKDLVVSKDLEKKISQQVKIVLTPKLKEYIALLSQMDVCFHGEGGGMHIAAALGISQVVLFGQTSPLTWAPLSDKSSILSDKTNVNNIKEDEIIQALEKKFQSYNLQKS